MFDMNKQYEIDTINKDFYNLIVNKLEESFPSSHIYSTLRESYYRYIIFRPYDGSIGANCKQYPDEDYVSISINELFKLIEQTTLTVISNDGGDIVIKGGNITVNGKSVPLVTMKNAIAVYEDSLRKTYL